jgi:hypothetical protein
LEIILCFQRMSVCKWNFPFMGTSTSNCFCLLIRQSKFLSHHQRSDVPQKSHSILHSFNKEYYVDYSQYMIPFRSIIHRFLFQSSYGFWKLNRLLEKGKKQINNSRKRKRRQFVYKFCCFKNKNFVVLYFAVFNEF